MPRGRRDANESEIVDALRAAGCEVIRLEDPDHAGVLDLLVFSITGLKILEVKTTRGRVRKEQAALISRWPDLAVLVRSAAEALTVMGFGTRRIRYEDRHVAQTG